MKILIAGYLAIYIELVRRIALLICTILITLSHERFFLRVLTFPSVGLVALLVFVYVEKFSLHNFFKFFVCNPCQSSPSLTILVPLWFIIISLVFFYLSKLLFSSFLQLNQKVILCVAKIP